MQMRQNSKRQNTNVTKHKKTDSNMTKDKKTKHKGPNTNVTK